MAKTNRSSKPLTLVEQHSEGINQVCEAAHVFQAIRDVVMEMYGEADYSDHQPTLVTLTALAEKGMRATSGAITMLDETVPTVKTIQAA